MEKSKKTGGYNMIHSCYLGDIATFETIEELLVYMIKIHDKKPADNNEILKSGNVQRAIFEKAGIIDLESLT